MGIGHLGPLEWISFAHLPNKETTCFQGFNFAILLDIYDEMVKDLGIKYRLHNKEFGRGILFRQKGSG
jgi:hypothetical protein